MRHRGRFFPMFLLSLALAAPARHPGEAPGEASAQDKAKGAANEARNPYVERFQQLDRDRDGYVSPAEWPLEPASFQRVDRNQDGRLSPGELLTPNLLRNERRRRQDGFERRDRDAGRSITRPERGDPSLDRENTWSPHATLQDQRRFRNLDRNRDDRLSRLEWTGSNAAFHRLDRNRDGVLSPHEWQR